MSAKIAQVRAATNTSTGNQTFTATGKLGGLTPVAALFIITGGTADGTPVDGARMGVGSATATDERSACVCNSEHGQDFADTGRAYSATICIGIQDLGAQTTDGTADFVSFGAESVTVNWTEAPGSAFLMTVVLFAGTDVSAYTGTISFADTTDEAVDVTDPGFQPECLIAYTAGINTGAGTTAAMSIGYARDNGAGTDQANIGWADADAFDTMVVLCCNRTDSAVCMPAGGGVDWYGEVGSWDSSGFTMTSRNAGANNSDVGYLALSFNGTVQTAVAQYSTPTSTGSDSETGLGFRPMFVLINLTYSEGTFENDDDAGPFGLGSWDSTDQYSNLQISEDAAAASNTESESDDIALLINQDDGTAGISATLTSFDSDGWTLSYSATDGVAKLLPYIAFEQTGIAQAAYNYRRRRSA